MKKPTHPGVMIYRKRDPKAGDLLPNIYCGQQGLLPKVGISCTIQNAATEWMGRGMVHSRSVRHRTYTVRVVML